VTRTTQDTRRFRRQTVRILVDYQSHDGVRCDYATTLGAGGLFIATEDPLEVGTVIKTRFRLAGAGSMHEIEGHVVWTRSEEEGKYTPGMAIQFDDPVASAQLARELGDFAGEMATSESGSTE
jgi:uncharacterized protein (TIGR02266 family)